MDTTSELVKNIKQVDICIFAPYVDFYEHDKARVLLKSYGKPITELVKILFGINNLPTYVIGRYYFKDALLHREGDLPAIVYLGGEIDDVTNKRYFKEGVEYIPSATSEGGNEASFPPKDEVIIEIRPFYAYFTRSGKIIKISKIVLEEDVITKIKYNQNSYIGLQFLSNSEIEEIVKRLNERSE